MQFARRFLIAAVCAIGVLVSASAVRAQNTNLLPNDTEMVVTINIQQILKSDVAKANKALVELLKGKIAEKLDEKGVEKWLRKANFDVFKDLSSVTFALPGGRDNTDQGFILLEGKFDAAKIKEAALELAKDKETEGKIKLVQIADIDAFEVTPKEDKTMYVGVLNKKTLIACGSKKDFVEAVARVKGTKKVEFKSEVVSGLIKTITGPHSISMIATNDILVKLGENNPNPKGGGKAAVSWLKDTANEGFSSSITIQKDIDFQAGVNAKDNKTAKEMAALVNTGLDFAKAKAKEKSDDDAKFGPALDVLNSIRVTTDGNNLLIRGQISFDTLDKILQNLPTP